MKPQAMLSWIFSLVALAAVVIGVQAQDRNHDHDELRAMLKTVTEAMNSRNIDAMAPLFHDKFSITTVDQQVFTNLNDFKTYFNGLFTGDKAPLKSVTFNPTADALTEFVGEEIGLSHGSSTDAYVFSDGETRVMTSRWTATLYKSGGKWKILNVHIGANLFDNPVITALKSWLYKVGVGAGVAGLLLGFGLARLMRRRPA
ncbi:MAG: YybH family protein [Blastocatellia bacterium]